MKAGILKELITVIESVITKNEFGEETVEWQTKYNTRAKLVHDSGSRGVINDEVLYNYIKTFQVRDYVPVNEFNRIIWNDNTYRILDIEPNKEQMMLIIKTELVND